MTDTILARLKTAYSPLGLGEPILKALAASLASTGLVTDDNVDAVVAAQKEGLVAIQKSNDKRVGEALDKAKAEADRRAEAARAELEGLRSKVAELTAAAEAAKAPAQAPAPPAAPAPQVAPAPDDRKWFEEEKSAMLAELEGRMRAFAEGNKSLTEAVEGLRRENEAMKAAEAQRAREAFIAGKARELGIPEWRMQEGFSLAPDAADDAVVEHLTRVAEHIRAQALPAGGAMLALGAGAKPDPAQMEEIARRLVSRG